VTVVTGASFMQEQCDQLAVGRAISTGGICHIDEIFNLLPQTLEDLVVGKRAQAQATPLEIDETGSAPESEISIVGFSGTIHPTSHHCDGDIVAGVLL